MRKSAASFLAIVAVVLLSASVLHGKTIVVDCKHAKAADTNSGTVESPLKTISAAVARLKPGDTALVQPGVYRERVVLASGGSAQAPVVLRSAVKHGAVITGSDVITDWTELRPGVWTHPDIPVFALRGQQAQRDGRRIPGNQAFLDGEPLMWADDTRRLLPGSWHLERGKGKKGMIYVALPEGRRPENSRIEVTTRAGLVFSRKPIDYVHIIGFHITHDGSPVRSWGTGIQITGRGWVVADNLLDWCANRGLTYLYSADFVIKGNRFAWNGQMAVGGGTARNMTFTDNELLYSNWRRISLAWEAGAVKFSSTVDSHVARNTCAYNYGAGLWFDGFDNGNLIERNIIHDNLNLGIFTEIDWHQNIRENLVYNIFDGNGIAVAETPGCYVTRNVVFNCGKSGLYVRGSDRREAGQHQHLKKHLDRFRYMSPVRKARQEGEFMIYYGARETYKSVNTLFWENLVFDNGKSQYWEHRHYGHEPHYRGRIDNLSDRNIFWADDPARLFAYRTGSYGGLDDWRKASGRDAESVVMNPWAKDAKLPAWVAGIVDLGKHRYRKPADIAALDLRLIDCPAAAVLYSRIVRSRIAEPMALADGGLKALKLEVDQRPAVALWNTQAFGRKLVRLATGMRSVEIESPWLNRKQVQTTGGAVEVPVTFMPVYVLGIGTELKELATHALDVRQFNEPGKPVPATVVIANGGSAARKATIDVQPLKGWLAEPARVERRIAAGATARVPVTLTCPARAEVGAYTVRMTGKLGDEVVERVSLYLVGEGAGKIPRAHGKITVDAQLADWGDLVAKGAPLGVVGDAKRIVEDKLKDWGGAKDCSARIWAAWASDALYIAADVTDEKVIRSEDPEQPWAADAVEIFIDGRSEAMQWQRQPTTGCYQIGVGPATKERPKTAVAVFQKKLDGLQAAASQRKDGYVVEVRIPLSAVNFPAGEWKAGRVIRMSLLFNDDDKPGVHGRDHVLAWGGSAQNFRDTTGWHILAFDAAKP